MGIISEALARVISNPTLDLSMFAVAADRLAWHHDRGDFELSEYRPGWQDDEYQPTEQELAENQGYEMGLSGEPAPNVLDTSISYTIHAARRTGYIAGAWERREQEAMERAEFELWLDSIEDPEVRSAYDDVVRSRSYAGHPASEV